MGKQKFPNRSGTSISNIQFVIFFFCGKIFEFNVFPQYLPCFRRIYLFFLLIFNPIFCWSDSHHYTLFLVFTYRPLSLLSCIIDLFFFNGASFAQYIVIINKKRKLLYPTLRKSLLISLIVAITYCKAKLNRNRNKDCSCFSQLSTEKESNTLRF